MLVGQIAWGYNINSITRRGKNYILGYIGGQEEHGSSRWRGVFEWQSKAQEDL